MENYNFIIFAGYFILTLSQMSLILVICLYWWRLDEFLRRNYQYLISIINLIGFIVIIICFIVILRIQYHM